MLGIELLIAATAALDRPGNERAALWQTRLLLTTEARANGAGGESDRKRPQLVPAPAFLVDFAVECAGLPGCDHGTFWIYKIYTPANRPWSAHIMQGGEVIPMNKPVSFTTLNQAKMDFSDLYTSSDPRNYFKYLGQLDYIIPHLAQPIFGQLIRARQELQDEPVTVLDLGCSYAINGALMKYALGYEELRQRYTAPAVQTLSSDELLALDRHFYRSWPKHEGVRVIGLDISENAIRYAQACGILDGGLAIDLENDDLTPEEANLLADVDIIVSTGCVGYVTAKTFARVMKASRRGRAPWVASFVLRIFPFDEIEKTLGAYGLVTEPYEGATFVQRRFANREEMEAAVRAVEARGIDSEGCETEGLYHANLLISRPAEEIERCPIQKLVTVVSGANKLWPVGTNVLGSYGPSALRRARAGKSHLAEVKAASS